MSASMFPDLDVVIDIVKSAARAELLSRFARSKQHLKDDGSIITEADLAMQQALHAQLSAHWPDLAFLGEEMSTAEQESILHDAEQGVWIVDPLDGTSNFSTGIGFFSVSVALIVRGEIVLAVVYDPLRDECFSAQRGRGARLNDVPLTLSQHSHNANMTIGLVDFKRLPAPLATKLAIHPPYKSQRSFGSVALDWCWIAAARGDVYVHGRQKLWDYAAGYLILAEAGGYSATLQGEPVYNRSLEPRSAVLAVNEQLFNQWLAYLQQD